MQQPALVERCQAETANSSSSSNQHDKYKPFTLKHLEGQLTQISHSSCGGALADEEGHQDNGESMERAPGMLSRFARPGPTTTDTEPANCITLH